ncbi:MAG TPA: hypothetical protein GX513_12860, partial [Firmicutes bacterium]|nr:hypothetical protein [Bacillota bacterium]
MTPRPSLDCLVGIFTLAALLGSTFPGAFRRALGYPSPSGSGCRQGGSVALEVPFSRDISSEDRQAVLSVLDTPFLALGPYLRQFEEVVAAYVGVRFGVAANSGTALHLLVRAFGIGEGDEVITTPFSFIASSNCILYERARPVFVDVEADTGNIDPGLIEAAITPRTRAILPVDAFGHPARLDIIRDMADRHGLVVIEDSCESLGSEYKGKKCGSPAYAHGAAFAFYPNKQITTG